ncbi:MAG: DUF3048 domain-containing protein [Lachnospiraceae bacterium]
MKANRIYTLVTLIIMAIFLASCGKKQDEDTNISVVEEQEPTEMVDSHEGQVPSKLTGLYMDEELAENRPLAIMMGNTSEASPQSGIGSAGVIYEIPVEGGITRLMSIIEDYQSLQRIGSVRSCRYYFVHYAMEYDALYAHFGQSKYALPVLGDSRVDNINGLEGETNSVFYRTSDRKAPHNAFADGQKLYEYVENKGYSVSYHDDYQGHFQFAQEEEPNMLIDGEDAGYVRPGYSIDNPWFVYQEEDGLYYRYQYNKEHRDNETGKQLSCKNIIIQYVPISLLDDGKSLNVNTTAGGNGVFITNGKAVNITWKKSSEFDITHYYDTTGEEISLNPGVTWVLLVDRNKEEKVEIKSVSE